MELKNKKAPGVDEIPAELYKIVERTPKRSFMK